MGGDACIANTRLPVWLLVSLRQQSASDAERTDQAISAERLLQGKLIRVMRPS